MDKTAFLWNLINLLILLLYFIDDGIYEFQESLQIINVDER